MTQLKAQAIQTALMGDWNAAISLNQSLLEDNPDDIDTLNRLAFAFSSIGNISEAKTLYQKVLTLDNQNPIASRNLKRLNGSSGAAIKTMPSQSHVSNLFIEEPGKTKVIELLNVADKKVVTSLRSGEPVSMQIKRMKIFILDQQKQYIGMLPDDIGRRLIRFMDGGNQYDAYIKSADDKKVIIFARETKQAPKFKNQPSFISSDRTKFVITSSKGSQKNARVREESDNDDKDYDEESEE